MYVKTLAEDGRVLEEGWEYKKPADVHQKNGLAQLPRYVDMLLNSKRWLASVSAFQIDGDEGVSVDKKDGRVRLVDFFQSPPNAERERLARTICKRKGFSIEEDYLTEQQTRVVSWNLPSNRAVILDTLHQFAKEIHGISEEEGLKIDFHEDDDESHKFQDAGSISFVFTYPFPDPTAPAPKN